MLVGTKKLLGNEFKEFCEEMILAAENDQLPIGVKLIKTEGVKLQDIADLCCEFSDATGLDMSAHLSKCYNCGKFHIMFEINYQDEQEKETIYLQ